MYSVTNGDFYSVRASLDFDVLTVANDVQGDKVGKDELQVGDAIILFPSTYDKDYYSLVIKEVLVSGSSYRVDQSLRHPVNEKVDPLTGNFPAAQVYKLSIAQGQPSGGTWESWPGDHACKDEAHFYMECSNQGICDRFTGVCMCYEGFEGGMPTERVWWLWKIWWGL